jgi:hypothetical protein
VVVLLRVREEIPENSGKNSYTERHRNGIIKWVILALSSGPVSLGSRPAQSIRSSRVPGDLARGIGSGLGQWRPGRNQCCLWVTAESLCVWPSASFVGQVSWVLNGSILDIVRTRVQGFAASDLVSNIDAVSEEEGASSGQSWNVAESPWYSSAFGSLILESGKTS